MEEDAQEVLGEALRQESRGAILRAYIPRECKNARLALGKLQKDCKNASLALGKLSRKCKHARGPSRTLHRRCEHVRTQNCALKVLGDAVRQESVQFCILTFLHFL